MTSWVRLSSVGGERCFLSGVGGSVDEGDKEKKGGYFVLDRRKNKKGKDHLVLYKTNIK